MNRLILPLATLTLLFALPNAAAASVPLIGELEPGWGMFFFVAGLLGVIALVGGAGLIRKIPAVGKGIVKAATPLAVFGLILASAVNPGGFINGFMEGDTPATASVAEGASFDTASYEATSDVTFYAADASSKASISPSVKIYKSGVTEKAAYEGSATADYSASMSSGTVTISGVQAQLLGCKVDVVLDLSAYYEQTVRDVNICVAKNVLGNNDISVPTFYMEKAGTLNLAKSDSSLTCTAGSQCAYTLTIRNTAADTYVHAPAVKFLNVDSATLDSVDANQACELIEVNSVQYIKFNENLDPLGLDSCAVRITRATGDTDGSFTWTFDDLFQQFGSTGWNTNSNIRGATATSAYTVSFA